MVSSHGPRLRDMSKGIQTTSGAVAVPVMLVQVAGPNQGSPDQRIEEG